MTFLSLMAGNRPRRLINFLDWEIRLLRKSGIVEKFRISYIENRQRFCRAVLLLNDRPSQQLLSSCFKLESAHRFRRGEGQTFKNFRTGPGAASCSGETMQAGSALFGPNDI